MRSKLTVLVLLAMSGARGQTFEVASVKASGPVTSKQGMDEVKRFGAVQVDGAQVDAVRVTLADLVRQAYALKAFQFSGPGWMSNERYDVHAKLPAGATPDRMPAMLQALLTDRFQLAFHRESKEHAVYALTVGKNGSKLQIADTARDRKMAMVDGAFRVDRNMTMTELCDFLGRFVDRPVVDMTELKETYQVVFDIPADELKRAKIAAEGLHGGDTASDPSGSSAIFAAIQQLGLRMEPRKMAVDVLVVDHAERVPTEN